MKNKDLIKILQALDPEDKPLFQLGRDDSDRIDIAKAAVVEPCILDILDIGKVEILLDSTNDDKPFANVILDSAENVSITVNRFNEKYGKENGCCSVSIEQKRHYMAVLLKANRYRRDDNVPSIYHMPNPKELGEAIDFAIEYMRKA